MNRKKVIIIFVAFIILLLAIHYYRLPGVLDLKWTGDEYFPKLPVSNRIPRYELTHAPVLTATTAELKYKAMKEKYESKLASVSARTYKPSDAYIDLGPAVSSLMNGSGKPASRRKLVFLWTASFGRKSASWIQAAFDDCPSVVPCDTTTNEKNLLLSDAVIIHPRDMEEYHMPLPAKRLPWQRWVYYLQEPPYITGANLSDFNGVFNWTATYRQDADFRTGYGGLKKKKAPMTTQELEILTSIKINSKRKLVAARISNCFEKYSDRLAYIAELGKHISVDFYGKCGNMSFPKEEKEGDDLLKEYKFYLAFENSNCRDYITEKFWSPMNHWWAVPVVMGAAPVEYQAVAPEESFIHTAGFESPKDLAEYLHLLDKTSHLYRRYFEWHQYWEATSGVNWCKLCLDLNNVSLPVKSYRDFKGWYSEDTCKV